MAMVLGGALPEAIATASHAGEDPRLVLNVNSAGEKRLQLVSPTGDTAELTLGAPRLTASNLPMPLPLSRAKVLSREKGAWSIAWGLFEERYEPVDGGFEQTFHFTKAPLVGSDIEVCLRVGGAPFAGARHNTLVFGKQQGFSIGKATWIDAEGTSTALTTALREDTLCVSLPDAVVQRSRFPAFIDPLISPEFAIDPPAGPPADANQGNVSAAIGAGATLLVWQDARATGPLDIYGLRLDSNGRPLDSVGFKVASAVGTQSLPSVAFDGTNFVVVWQDDRVSTLDIYGARVSPAGAVLDPNGFVISNAVSNQTVPAIRCGGTRCLVLWQDTRDAGLAQIYGSRLETGTGAVLDPSGFRLAATTTGQARPAVDFDGTQFVATWSETPAALSFEIHTAKVNAVTPTATVSARRTVASGSNPVVNPVLAQSQNTSLIVWAEGPAGQTNIVGSILNTDTGAVLAANIPICSATGAQTFPTVDVTPGGFYWVAWTDARAGAATSAVYGAVVETNGALISSPKDGQLLAGRARNPHLRQGSPSGWLLTYERLNDTVGQPGARAFRRWLASQGIAAPTVTAPTSNQSVGNRPTFTGTTPRFTSVTLVVDGLEVAFPSFSDDGTFSLVLPNALATGQHRVAAIAVDAIGARSAVSTEVPFTVVADDAGIDPDAGPLSDGGTSRLRFNSTPDAAAACGEPWRYAPQTNATDSEWILSSNAPPGLALEAGVLRWTPLVNQRGTAQFALTARNGPDEVTQDINVTVSCEPRTYNVGCGCHAGNGFWWLGLLWLCWRPTQRRQR
jgi:hypothetical protein